MTKKIQSVQLLTLSCKTIICSGHRNKGSFRYIDTQVSKRYIQCFCLPRNPGTTSLH